MGGGGGIEVFGQVQWRCKLFIPAQTAAERPTLRFHVFVNTDIHKINWPLTVNTGIYSMTSHEMEMILNQTLQRKIWAFFCPLKENKPRLWKRLIVKANTRHPARPRNETLRTPTNSGCPSGSRRCLSIHWDHSFLLFCLPPLSPQLKVTHQPQVWARLPDGWNDRASFSSAAPSVEKSVTCVSTSYKCCAVGWLADALGIEQSSCV